MPGVEVVDAGAGLAEVFGVALVADSPALLVRVDAEDAPRRGPALGGIVFVK